MTGRLADKVALITGAAGGIGSVSARRFAAEGAHLVLVDLPSAQDRLGQLAGDLAQVEGSVGAGFPVTADIRQFEQIQAATQGAVDRFGHLDIVFANAGYLCRGALTDHVDVQQATWQESLDTNITGTWHTLKAASGILLPQGTGGSIVVTSSIAGIRSGLNNAAYSAAKHAVIGIAKTAAHELGRAGIRVNCVLPTGVHTDMFVRPERVRQARPDLSNPTLADAAQVWSGTNLLGVPWIEAIDVANAALFLASDEARYLTGVSLLVDAGQSQINPFAALESWIGRTTRQEAD